jgi:hypothetical protein
MLLYLQYYYGEDGMDVCKAQFLTQKQLPVLCNNSNILTSGKDMEKLLRASNQEELASAKKEVNHVWIIYVTRKQIHTAILTFPPLFSSELIVGY